MAEFRPGPLLDAGVVLDAAEMIGGSGWESPGCGEVHPQKATAVMAVQAINSADRCSARGGRVLLSETIFGRPSAPTPPSWHDPGDGEVHPMHRSRGTANALTIERLSARWIAGWQRRAPSGMLESWRLCFKQVWFPHRPRRPPTGHGEQAVPGLMGGSPRLPGRNSHSLRLAFRPVDRCRAAGSRGPVWCAGRRRVGRPDPGFTAESVQQRHRRLLYRAVDVGGSDGDRVTEPRPGHAQRDLSGRPNHPAAVTRRSRSRRAGGDRVPGRAGPPDR